MENNEMENRKEIRGKDGSIAGYIRQEGDGWWAFRAVDSQTALRPMEFSAINFVIGKG